MSVDGALVLIALALATSAGSITLAKSGMFHPYRVLVAKWNTTLGHMVACWYCTSHWVAAALVGLCYQRFIDVGDAVIMWLAVIGFSALWSGLVLYYTPFLPPEPEVEHEVIPEAHGYVDQDAQ